MPARIIDGRALADDICRRIRHDAEALAARGRRPCLAGVLVGDDPGSHMYAASQAGQAERVGITHRLIHLPETTTAEGLGAALASLNADSAVSGVLLYQPLPPSLSSPQQRGAVGSPFSALIAPEKDVEGLHPMNLGRLAQGQPALAPCTAAAAMACLRSTGVDLAGCEAVVIGRSPIVGRPLAMLLLVEHATVTLCHTRTRDLAAHSRRADVLMAAAGKPGVIGREHVREDAIVIDVGTHRVSVDDGRGGRRTRTIGDVRYHEVAEVAGWITPVPGGVGPVTVAMLLSNVVAAASQTGSSSPHR